MGPPCQRLPRRSCTHRAGHRAAFGGVGLGLTGNTSSPSSYSSSAPAAIAAAAAAAAAAATGSAAPAPLAPAPAAGTTDLHSLWLELIGCFWLLSPLGRCAN